MKDGGKAFSTLALFLLLLAAGTALADEVRLKNGRILPCKIVGMEDGKLLLKTSYAGEIPITWSEVATLRTDAPAQVMVMRRLEPELGKHFHPDSYGYRPGKSAVKAVGVARKRCWQNAWVLDIDIKGFFDNIDHELLMRAVEQHSDCKWVRLYITRWLKAPVQMLDGSVVAAEKGTPQGGVISPLLANLFLHYAFDRWMQRNCPHIPFERYADDVICHCESEGQATWLLGSIVKRMSECKLELNLQKTHIVYCKDNRRKKNYPKVKFDFLGFTF